MLLLLTRLKTKMSNSEQEPKLDRTEAPLRRITSINRNFCCVAVKYCISLFVHTSDKPFCFHCSPVFVIVHLPFGYLWTCDCKWAKKLIRRVPEWSLIELRETLPAFPPTALLLMALNGAAECLKQTKEQLQCI